MSGEREEEKEKRSKRARYSDSDLESDSYDSSDYDSGGEEKYSRSGMGFVPLLDLLDENYMVAPSDTNLEETVLEQKKELQELIHNSMNTCLQIANIILRLPLLSTLLLRSGLSRL